MAEVIDAPAPPPGLLVHAAIILLILLLGQLLISEQPVAGAALEIRDLNLRPHLRYVDALQLNAVLSNRSGHPQPYPDLLVHFSNRFGERLSQALFPPSSYLQGEAANSEAFPANTRLLLSLNLADPSRGAVNYGMQLYFVTQL